MKCVKCLHSIVKGDNYKNVYLHLDNRLLLYHPRRASIVCKQCGCCDAVPFGVRKKTVNDRCSDESSDDME